MPGNDGGNFRLLSVATDNASMAYRFKSATGETWAYNNHGPTWYWQKLTEAGSVPSGDYDMQAHAYVDNKKAAAVLFRLERKTGQASLSKGLDWAHLAEPVGGMASAPPTSGFRLVTSASMAGWSAFRFNPETGETWTPITPGGKSQLQRIADPQPIGVGDYDLQATSFISSGKPANVATRINRKTGQCWATADPLTAWQAIAEPPVGRRSQIQRRTDIVAIASVDLIN